MERAQLPYGQSVQIDPLFGYYQDRSPASIATEVKVNGYRVARYIVTADSRINPRLIDAFHEEAVAVWYATFGNGTYSRVDLPAGWEAWRMVTRSDLTGKPLSDGYTRLCLNNPDYRTWKKRQIAHVLKEHPFDGIDIMEPHWPEYPGIESPAYACFCEACGQAFRRQFPKEEHLPDILISDSAKSPQRNPELWRKWLVFREASLRGFLNDLVNGPGGIRESAPRVKVCTWSLALLGPNGVQRVLEDSGEDAGAIVRDVKPDLHCLQTHWPDWLQPDLPPEYVEGYRPFVEQIRVHAPDVPLMIQADTGSKPGNRRSWAWIRAFERSCRKVGVTSTTFYEYFIGDYIYTDPPRIAEVRPDKGGVLLVFDKRVQAKSAADLAHYTLSDGRITAARVDGNLVRLSLTEVPPDRPCRLTVRDISDDAERRLFKDKPPAVLDQQTVEFKLQPRP